MRMRLIVTIGQVLGLVLASGVYGTPLAAGPGDRMLSAADAAAQAEQAQTGQGGARPTPRMPVQRPPRDPRAEPSTPPVGTGTVSGRVVDAATGQPLPRARVRLSGRAPRSVLTDAQGVFTFEKVAAGAVNLSAEKAAYVNAMLPDMRRSMRRAGMMLAEGQKLEGLTLSMWRGGGISGRVLDPYGDPIEGVGLSAILVPAAGRTNTRSMMRGSQSTNDIGEFRIGRLEPGTYYLLAMPRRQDFGPRGRGMEEEETSTALGRTYYPGVPSVDQAQPITLEKGQSVTGIELTVLETPITKVTGLVTDSKGQAVSGGNIMVRSAATAAMGWSEGGGQIQEDGSFEMRLQPGEYILEAMVRPRDERAGGGGPQARREQEQGSVKLAVSGEEMSGVVITSGGGATASGRFVFEGDKPPPPNLAQAMVNFTDPNSAGGPSNCRMSGRPTVNADGTFLAERIFGTCIVGAGAPGGWQFKSVLHRGTDITRRPIDFQGGQPMTDLQVVFTDRVGELTFEVSDDAGTDVSEYVVLVFPADKSLWSDPRAVRPHVVSRERDAMMAAMGGMMMRMEMTSGFMTGASMTATGPGIATRPGTGSPGGSATPGAMLPGGATQALRGLLPGDYFAIALDDASYEDVRDPGFLGTIAPFATRISVGAGETKSVPLRRATLPDTPR